MNGDLPTLMQHAEEIAKRERDGHLTLMRFTGGWKILPRTPDIRGSGPPVRNEHGEIVYGSKEDEIVHHLPVFKTLEEALQDYIVRGHAVKV